MRKTSVLPTADSARPVADVPVSETAPQLDPLREVVKLVELDCRVAPREYLEEVRVPIGGE